MSRLQAYHPVLIKDPNKPRTYYASCIVELPSGNIKRIYQSGASEIGAITLLTNLVGWMYGVSVQQQRDNGTAPEPTQEG